MGAPTRSPDAGNPHAAGSREAVAPIRIRKERPGDEAAIRAVLVDAFETEGEADLVDRVRQGCGDRQLSWVATESRPEGGEQIVGHILFTPVIGHDADGERIDGLGLAPMAVRASHQCCGVGTTLIRHGLAEIERSSVPYIIVLGHPDYYPRFGFEPASLFGVHCEYPDVPDEAFMLRPLEPEAVDRLRGVVRYRPEFAAV